MKLSLETQLERALLPLKLDRLRRDHEIGDPTARHEALRLCTRHGHTMPDWLVYLEDVDAAVALGDACYLKRRGTRSLFTKAKEIREKRMVAAALEACGHAGLEGDEKRAKASELLAQFRVYRSKTTLHSPKTIEPTVDEYEPFRRMLGINVGLGGYLIEDDDFRVADDDER